MTDFAYCLEADGSLALRDGDDTILTIAPAAHFALLYDRDSGPASMATLLKHGPAEHVRAHHQTMTQAFAGLKALPHSPLARLANDLELIEIPVAAMTDAVVEELNACLACSGRVGKIKERLGILAQAA